MSDDAPSQPAGKDSPHLEDHERKQAAIAQPIQARVIHEVLREEGEIELRRSVRALLWSGLAAGMSMGFSFLAMTMLKIHMDHAAGAEAIAPLGYSIGFIVTVLGKQQLFTETTLTATLPILHNPTLLGVGRLARMWAAVLVSNLVGTMIFAYLISRPGFLTEETGREFLETARASFSAHFGTGFLRAIFSGWLIALIVWLLPAAKTAAPFVIAALTYVVALASLPHVVAGSTEAAYAVFVGGAEWSDYWLRFLAPTLLGNVVGGTIIAALLNHAPVAHDMAARQAED